MELSAPEGSPDVMMLVGHCAFGSPDAALLVSLLQPLVPVRDDVRLATLVELLSDGTRGSRPAHGRYRADGLLKAVVIKYGATDVERD